MHTPLRQHIDAVGRSAKAAMTSLAFPVVAFLCFRLVLSSIGWFVLTIDATLRNGHALVRSPSLLAHPFLDAFFRWDAGYYSSIAKEGYSNVYTSNFFPLFSLEARALLTAFRVESDVACVLAASVNALLATVALFSLAKTLLSEKAAQWTVVAYVCFPFSFFQLAAYPESLTVALGASACLFARQQRPVAIFAMCVLAGLSRHTTLYAVLAAAVMGFVVHRRFLFGVLPVLSWSFGLSIFSAYEYAVFGDPLQFLHVRKLWLDGFTPVWTLEPSTASILMPGVAVTLISLIPLAMLLTSRAGRWIALAGMVWIAVLLTTGSSGLGRHSSSVWPIAIAVGRIAERWPSAAMIAVPVGAMAGGLMFSLFIQQWLMY